MGGMFHKAKKTAEDKASEHLDKDQRDQQGNEQRPASEDATERPAATGEEGGEEGWAHTEEGTGYHAGEDRTAATKAQHGEEGGEEGWAHTEEGTGYDAEDDQGPGSG